MRRVSKSLAAGIVAIIAATALFVGAGQGAIAAGSGGNNCVVSFTQAAQNQAGYYGYFYSYTFEAYGCPAPTIYRNPNSTLPPGLSLSGITNENSQYATATLSGTLSASSGGIYPFQLEATNGNPGAAVNVTFAEYGRPQFQNASPGSGQKGVGYGYQFSDTALSASVTFQISSGSLPPGLGLSSSGYLSGTPTTAGTYSFQVQTSNASDSAYANLSITINGPPSFTAASPPNGLEGTPYSYQFAAYGPPAATSFTASGTLPPGLTLSSSGLLSGTPTASGISHFTVTAANGYTPNTTTGDIALEVDQAPVFTAASPPGGSAGSPYSYTFVAQGTAPIAYSAPGSLPGGLSLNASTGVLSGTPTTGGTTSVQVCAANVAGNTCSTIVPVLITAPPVFTASTPGTLLGVHVTYASFYQFAASGTPSPTFSWVGVTSPGNPIPGMSLDSTGLLHGSPSTVGTYTATVTATNSAGSTSLNVTITVIAAPVFTPSPPNGVKDLPYSYTFTALGATSYSVLPSGGILPIGLFLDGGTGVLSGTVKASNTFTPTICATNIAGSTCVVVTIVTGKAPVFTSQSPATTGKTGVAYSYQYAATSSVAVSYALNSGTLPPGISVTSDGLLGGTPTTDGVYSFTIGVTNLFTTTVSTATTITVTTAPVFPQQSPPLTATTGINYGAAQSGYTFAATGTATIAYSIVAGGNLDGLTLSAAGLLSGRPTLSGSFIFAVQAAGPGGTTQTSPFTLVVGSGVAPSISAASPPSAQIGRAYSYSFRAAGNPVPSFSTASTLPTGLRLGTDGTLSGTPLAIGSFSVSVTATNALGSDSRSVTLEVNTAPSFIASDPPDGQVGAPYSFTYSALGRPVPTFAVLSGTLPDGLTLDPATGVLSGTPTTPGDVAFVVSASNGVSPDATSATTITIAIAGVRSAWVDSAELSSMPTSASTAMSSGQLMLHATDSTNSTLGWNVTVASSPFVYSGHNGGASIPASAFALTSVGAVGWLGGQAISTGTDLDPLGPQSAALSSGVSGSLNTTRKVLLAGAGNGSGIYTQPLNVALTVPAGSKPGLYTATLTITISSGP